MAIFDLTPYETYVFILCMIVFVALTVLFTVLILYLQKLIVKIIRGGLQDEQILKEYRKRKGKRKKSNVSVFDLLFTGLFCCIAFIGFGYSIYLKYFEQQVTGDIPVYRVVLSGSMAKKYEKNEYLFENDLNDQFERFDMILTHKLPDEFDLQLYDIVVYEVDDMLIVHRIIGIEEPNADHPDERYFTLKGDAVEMRDRFPVRYEQMKAIYRGEKVPYVGSFVAFLQSPAGYICILLILFGVVTIPLLDKKIEKEKWKRLQVLLRSDKKSKKEDECEETVCYGYPCYVVGVCVPCNCPYVECPYKKDKL